MKNIILPTFLKNVLLPRVEKKLEIPPLPALENIVQVPTSSLEYKIAHWTDTPILPPERLITALKCYHLKRQVPKNGLKISIPIKEEWKDLEQDNMQHWRINMKDLETTFNSELKKSIEKFIFTKSIPKHEKFSLDLQLRNNISLTITKRVIYGWMRFTVPLDKTMRKHQTWYVTFVGTVSEEAFRTQLYPGPGQMTGKWLKPEASEFAVTISKMICSQIKGCPVDLHPMSNGVFEHLHSTRNDVLVGGVESQDWVLVF